MGFPLGVEESDTQEVKEQPVTGRARAHVQGGLTLWDVTVEALRLCWDVVGQTRGGVFIQDVLPGASLVSLLCEEPRVGVRRAGRDSACVIQEAVGVLDPRSREGRRPHHGPPRKARAVVHGGPRGGAPVSPTGKEASGGQRTETSRTPRRKEDGATHCCRRSPS